MLKIVEIIELFPKVIFNTSPNKLDGIIDKLANKKYFLYSKFIGDTFERIIRFTIAEIVKLKNIPTISESIPIYLGKK